MEHSFDVELAKQLGIAEALIFKHISYWVEENRKKNKYYFEGKYWTYNTIQAFCDKFSYLTGYEVKKAINTLLKEEYILEGNYNHNKMNRTRWFTVGEPKNAICRNQQMHLSNSTNAIVENDKSINKDKINIVYTREYIAPPTLEDVREFAKENSCLELADKFFKYYSLTNWLDKNGEIVNWKQKFLTWMNTEGTLTGQSVKLHQFENFKGRSYENIDSNDLFQSIDEIEI